jgi:glc operon protein GlcG
MIELTLDLAEKAARAALAKAKELGTHMTVTVVDESGRLVVVLRGDGTPFFSTETSRTKAIASANFRTSTKDLAEQSAKEPLFWSTISSVIPGQILIAMGGVPLRRSGRIVGGIGCGGGTAEQDHECAVAGNDAISD